LGRLGLNAAFTQTGGMNAALEIHLDGGAHLLVTDADDSLPWSADDLHRMGRWPVGGSAATRIVRSRGWPQLANLPGANRTLYPWRLPGRARNCHAERAIDQQRTAPNVQHAFVKEPVGCVARALSLLLASAPNVVTTDVFLIYERVEGAPTIGRSPARSG